MEQLAFVGIGPNGWSSICIGDLTVVEMMMPDDAEKIVYAINRRIEKFALCMAAK